MVVLRVLFEVVFGRILWPLRGLWWVARGGGRLRDPSRPVSRGTRIGLAIGLLVAITLLAVGLRTVREGREFDTAEHRGGAVVATTSAGPMDRSDARIRLDGGGGDDYVDATEYDVAVGDRVTAFRGRDGQWVVDERDHYVPIGSALLVLGAALLPGPVLVLARRAPRDDAPAPAGPFVS